MIIWATQFLLEKAYNTIYIDKRFKNIFFRLKNQKANKKDANHTFFTSSFMSSTTAEAGFSMAFLSYGLILLCLTRCELRLSFSQGCAFLIAFSHMDPIESTKGLELFLQVCHHRLLQDLSLLK